MKYPLEPIQTAEPGGRRDEELRAPLKDVTLTLRPRRLTMGQRRQVRAALDLCGFKRVAYTLDEGRPGYPAELMGQYEETWDHEDDRVVIQWKPYGRPAS